MESFEIKSGTSFETLEGTLLVAISVCTSCAVFKEYKYNWETNEYDLLIDGYRILNKERIKVELYRSFEKNYKVRMIED